MCVVELNDISTDSQLLTRFSIIFIFIRFFRLAFLFIGAACVFVCVCTAHSISVLWHLLFVLQ